MAKKQYARPWMVRLDEDLQKDIDAIALKKELGRAETVRRLLRLAVEIEKGADSIDHTLRIVRSAVQESIKSAENRLASIAAKNTIAAATAMYMSLFVIEQQTDLDPQEVYQLARKRAVAFLRANPERTESDDE